jgi:outer membrane protein TolC
LDVRRGDSNYVKRCRKHARAVLVAVLTLLQGGCATAPQPLSTGDISAFSAELIARTSVADEAIDGEIDVYDAIGRAIKYNADVKARELQIAVASAKVSAQNAALLPDFVADSSYYGRGRKDSSYSSLSPSYGASSDLALSWNILDFGLSYVRAQQAGDKALYQEEDYRRAVARVAEDTRLAYWRAVASAQLQERLPALQKDIDAALNASQAQSKDSHLDPMPALNYGRDILNEKRELNLLVSSLAGAEAQLKQLINVPQEQKLKLKRRHGVEHRKLNAVAPADSVKIALQNRAEIRQLIYQMRITSSEVDALLLQSLPGLSFNAGLAGASLSVLSNGNWVAWGAKAAWNIMSLLRMPASLDVIEAEKAALHQQALAVAVAISMQAYVSSAQHGLLKRVHDDSETYLKVQKQIERQSKVSVELGQSSKQALTRERLSTLLAETRDVLAYADYQNALGLYLSTLGIDFDGDEHVKSATAADVAARLRESAKDLPVPARSPRSGQQQTAGLQ